MMGWSCCLGPLVVVPEDNGKEHVEEQTIYLVAVSQRGGGWGLVPAIPRLGMFPVT